MENGTKKIIETRLLIKENNIWKPLNYIWSEDQQDAKLNYVGEKINASWIHTDGTKKSTIYNVPNNNQCKNCHLKGKDISPIGPTVAQLNRKYAMLSEKMSQLEVIARETVDITGVGFYSLGSKMLCLFKSICSRIPVASDQRGIDCSPKMTKKYQYVFNIEM